MINRSILLPLAFCFALTTAALAQETSPSPATTSTSKTAQVFDPAKATAAWLATVPPDKRAKSDAYFEGGYWFILWNFLLSAAILIFLLASRVSARLRDFAERTARFKALQVALYAIGFTLVTAI